VCAAEQLQVGGPPMNTISSIALLTADAFN